MTMGDEGFLDFDMMFLRGGEDAVKVSIGIDRRAFHRLGAPEHRTILLKRRHRDNNSLNSGHFAYPFTATVAACFIFAAFIGTSSS